MAPLLLLSCYVYGNPGKSAHKQTGAQHALDAAVRKNQEMRNDPFCTGSIVVGDAAVVLPRLITEGAKGSVKLAYLDPPFNTRGATATRAHYSDHRSTGEWTKMGLPQLLLTRGLRPL